MLETDGKKQLSKHRDNRYFEAQSKQSRRKKLLLMEA